MSDREALARDIRREYDNSPPSKYPTERRLAESLWAAGWRKKPSRDELARLIATMRLAPVDQPAGGPIADVILALMDGLTGENDE